MQRRRIIVVAIVLILLQGWIPCSASTDPTAVQALSADQFKHRLDQSRNDPDMILLDIRTPAEFKAGHIRGAVLIDYYARDFVDRLKQLDRNKTYLVYCRSGNRSARSLSIFGKLGFRHVYHLETGIRGWMQARYPVAQ